MCHETVEFRKRWSALRLQRDASPCGSTGRRDHFGGAHLVWRLFLLGELAPLAPDLFGNLRKLVVRVGLAHGVADGVREEHEGAH
eukprot:scaffold1136_cov260-Pinguiococcus_pyrenoidosus.AAC.5